MTAFKQNILIVKFGALGDVVRTAYLLPGLSAKHPDARIHWLTADSALELLRFNPYIYNLATIGSGYEQLKNLDIELAFSLDDEWEVLDHLAKIKINRVIGARRAGLVRTYCAASAPWFDMGLISIHGKERADELKRINQREHHTFLERIAGVRISSPSFFNSPVLEARVKASFAPGYFHVGLNSGAGGRWPSKQLRIGEAVKLIERLLPWRIASRPVKLWLLGGLEETARHQQICAAVNSERLVDSGYDQNILEFAARIKALDYLITTDSLALHLGIAQGVPNLSIYAPTSAAEIGTFGTGVKVVSTSADYCSYRPNADNTSITAERIMEAMRVHMGECGLVVTG